MGVGDRVEGAEKRRRGGPEKGAFERLDPAACPPALLAPAPAPAIGLSRAQVEGMNMGFLLLAFNQISNNCGMLHYTSGGQFKVGQGRGRAAKEPD